MMKEKLVKISLTAVLVLCLTGCGSGTEGRNTDSSDKETPSVTEEDAKNVAEDNEGVKEHKGIEVPEDIREFVEASVNISRETTYEELVELFGEDYEVRGEVEETATKTLFWPLTNERNFHALIELKDGVCTDKSISVYSQAKSEKAVITLEKYHKIVGGGKMTIGEVQEIMGNEGTLGWVHINDWGSDSVKYVYQWSNDSGGVFSVYCYSNGYLLVGDSRINTSQTLVFD